MSKGFFCHCVDTKLARSRVGKWRCLLEAPVIQNVPFHQVKPLGITKRMSQLAVDSYDDVTGKSGEHLGLGCVGRRTRGALPEAVRGHSEQSSLPVPQDTSLGFRCCPASFPCLQAVPLGCSVCCSLPLLLSRIRPSQAVWRQKDASVSPSSLQTARAHFPNLNHTQKLALHGHGCYF